MTSLLLCCHTGRLGASPHKGAVRNNPFSSVKKSNMTLISPAEEITNGSAFRRTAALNEAGIPRWPVRGADVPQELLLKGDKIAPRAPRVLEENKKSDVTVELMTIPTYSRGSPHFRHAGNAHFLIRKRVTLNLDNVLLMCV